MNHASEHDIDRVLTALRDTEPSVGMESRILQALESRTPARSTWFLWTSPMQWGVAALATAAIVVAVALTAHTPHTQTAEPAIATTGLTQNSVISTEAQPSPSVISTGGQPSPLVISTGAQRSGEIAASTEANTTQPPAFLKSAGIPTAPAYPPHELLCDCDPIAMAEMQAPSHPAPEMPLTAQERLLQRVVHHGDPVEIAELEPFRSEPRPAAVSIGEDAALKHVVQDFLKRLAAAETLNPTAPMPAADSDSNDPGPSVGSSSNPN